MNIPFIFKSSYKKANRTSLNSFIGIGDDEALVILQKAKKELDIPVLTDIHTEAEAAKAAQVVDVLQIPAFLCRQTDLVKAAAASGRCGAGTARPAQNELCLLPNPIRETTRRF